MEAQKLAHEVKAKLLAGDSNGALAVLDGCIEAEAERVKRGEMTAFEMLTDEVGSLASANDRLRARVVELEAQLNAGREANAEPDELVEQLPETPSDG